MPTSFEGLEYTRHLFKPIENSESGGCHADVYLPDNSILGPYPIALSIHGGGYCTGDTHHIFQGHFRYLLDRGFCVVSSEYRLAPHARLRHFREDWLDTYRWVKNGLNDVTDGRVDPSKVFVFGGSAGGTATLFLGLDVHLAGLPPPCALYVIYPAIRWDGPWPGHASQVDYETFPELVATRKPEEQKLLNELIQGPVSTGYDCKTEHIRPLTGRRLWYDFIHTQPFLFSCILEESGPPYSKSSSFFDLVTPHFAPTVFVKALADVMVDPAQTSDAYDKLQELGVDSKLIEAKGMVHGDAEGENDIRDNPPRVKYFWEEVYNVALDWCIERTPAGGKEKKHAEGVSIPNGECVNGDSSVIGSREARTLITA